MDTLSLLLIILVVIVIIIVTVVIARSNQNPNQALDGQQDVEGSVIDDGVPKETFFALQGEARVNNQGAIVAENVYTNGLLNQPWTEIVDAVKNNKPLADKSVLGAGAGDSFAGAWQNQKKHLDITEGNEIGVKTPEEIAKIEKQLTNTSNNNTSCLFTRGGSTTAKIVLDPLGTRGVSDTYDTPERERNHKIYTGGSAVLVPGFNINTTNLTKELTINGTGWGKGLSGNTVLDTTLTEAKKESEYSAMSDNTQQAMETFSASY